MPGLQENKKKELESLSMDRKQENRAMYEVWKEAHGIILDQGARVTKNVAAADSEQHVASLIEEHNVSPAGEEHEESDAVDTKPQTLRETLCASMEETTREKGPSFEWITEADDDVPQTPTAGKPVQEIAEFKPKNQISSLQAVAKEADKKRDDDRFRNLTSEEQASVITLLDASVTQKPTASVTQEPTAPVTQQPAALAPHKSMASVIQKLTASATQQGSSPR
ncbi:hypothetical protein GGR56DRAFT_672839 [Xylariaceae sp. FL0804]|nr:hypothetical protein GGR56DRAFT_672839 [Xylariaceae sp. FL0804]